VLAAMTGQTGRLLLDILIVVAVGAYSMDYSVHNDVLFSGDDRSDYGW